MLIVWNVNSSIVNKRPLEVLIIKVCHCNVLFSGLICSQHAIEMDLVSQKVPNSLIPMIICIIKNKKLFKFFLHQTQPELTIALIRLR